MKVIILSIGTFNTTQLDGVTNIAYDSGTKTYTVTHSGGTSTYSAESNHINILW